MDTEAVQVQVWFLCRSDQLTVLVSGLVSLNSFLFISEKPQEEKKDTFVEKMATQVIKNLQVKISSIHLRYEDDVSTDPGFGFGFDPHSVFVSRSDSQVYRDHIKNIPVQCDVIVLMDR